MPKGEEIPKGDEPAEKKPKTVEGSGGLPP